MANISDKSYDSQIKGAPYSMELVMYQDSSKAQGQRRRRYSWALRVVVILLCVDLLLADEDGKGVVGTGWRGLCCEWCNVTQYLQLHLHYNIH